MLISRLPPSSSPVDLNTPSSILFSIPVAPRLTVNESCALFLKQRRLRARNLQYTKNSKNSLCIEQEVAF